jgi:transcriptional antiterminator RfaH
MVSNWYVARTQPRAESLAASELGRDGLEVFFPRIKAQGATTRGLDAPLFPGYLFVRFDPEAEGWPTLRPAHRMLGWVSFGGEVAWLPHQIVGELMERVKSINQEGGLWQRFQCGQKVRVVGNNFDSLAEVVEETRSPQGRAKVLLQFMGRLVQAQVPYVNLQPVETMPVETHPPPRRTRGGGRWVRGFGPTAVAAT